MTGQQPIMTSREQRVIQFKPRTLEKASSSQSSATYNDETGRILRQNPQGFSQQNATTKKDADDYRHRMTMNIVAMTFTLLLTVLGVWLANTIADLRQTQDCLLVGRRDCGRIPLPRADPPRPAKSI